MLDRDPQRFRGTPAPPARGARVIVLDDVGESERAAMPAVIRLRPSHLGEDLGRMTLVPDLGP